MLQKEAEIERFEQENKKSGSPKGKKTTFCPALK